MRVIHRVWQPAVTMNIKVRTRKVARRVIEQRKQILINEIFNLAYFQATAK